MAGQHQSTIFNPPYLIRAITVGQHAKLLDSSLTFVVDLEKQKNEAPLLGRRFIGHEWHCLTTFIHAEDNGQ